MYSYFLAFFGFLKVIWGGYSYFKDVEKHFSAQNIPKTFQKTQIYFNLFGWPWGFCHPLRPLCSACFWKLSCSSKGTKFNLTKAADLSKDFVKTIFVIKNILLMTRTLSHIRLLTKVLDAFDPLTNDLYLLIKYLFTFKHFKLTFPLWKPLKRDQTRMFTLWWWYQLSTWVMYVLSMLV